MSRRRRGWIALGCVLVVIVIGVVAFGPRGGKPELQLIFLGYTNVPASNFQAGDGSRWVTNWHRLPLFLASNAGPSRVKIASSYHITRSLARGDRVAWLLPGSSSIIRSHSATTVTFAPEGADKQFRAVVFLHQYGRTDQFWEWCRSSKSSFFAGLARRFSRPYGTDVATSEPITPPTELGFMLDDRGQPWPPPTNAPAASPR